MCQKTLGCSVRCSWASGRQEGQIKVGRTAKILPTTVALPLLGARQAALPGTSRDSIYVSFAWVAGGPIKLRCHWSRVAAAGTFRRLVYCCEAPERLFSRKKRRAYRWGLLRRKQPLDYSSSCTQLLWCFNCIVLINVKSLGVKKTLLGKVYFCLVGSCKP